MEGDERGKGSGTGAGHDLRGVAGADTGGMPRVREAVPGVRPVAGGTWRHLGVMRYLLELRCGGAAVRLPEHGVKTVTVPWAEPGSRFTFHFEAFAVAVIAACRSLTRAADLLRLHWDKRQRLIERAVERGLARQTRRTPSSRPR
ncbi:MAG: transposase family protein [Opitutaceae bacterium]|nr:transposase family protein [Opitutaceae bacterium]